MNVNKQIQAKIYNTVFVPALFYGSKFWTLAGKMQLKIVATEMSFLRKMGGVIRPDKVRNTKVRKILGVELIVCKIEENQLS